MRHLRQWFVLFTACGASLSAQTGASVTLGGQELWTVRAPIGAMDPTTRAADVTANLLNIAEDTRRNPADIRLVPGATDITLLVSRMYIASITDEDARIEGMPREALAAARAKIVTEAILRYREARSAGALARSAGLASLAFLLMVLFLAALRWIYVRAAAWFERFVQKIARVNRYGRLVRLFENTLEVIIRVALQFGAAAGGLAVATLTASYILGLFPATAGLSALLSSTVIGAVKDAAMAVASYLPNLLVLAVVAVLTMGMIRVAKTLRERAHRYRVVSR